MYLRRKFTNSFRKRLDFRELDYGFVWDVRLNELKLRSQMRRFPIHAASATNDNTCHHNN
jgi:hypothetical protein